MYKHMVQKFEAVKLDDQTGIIEGYASTWGNVDSQRDTVAKGAYKRTIDSGRKVKLLWQHDDNEPMGVITAMKEDERGLWFQAQLILESDQARQRYALLKAGAIDGVSIRGLIVQAEKDAKSGVQTLKEINLREISLVTFPANDQATVQTVKARLESLPAVASGGTPEPLEVSKMESLLTELLAVVKAQGATTLAGVATTMAMEERESALEQRRWKMRYALGDVMDNILEQDGITPADMRTQLAGAIDEYKGLMDAWVTDWVQLKTDMAAAQVESDTAETPDLSPMMGKSTDPPSPADGTPPALVPPPAADVTKRDLPGDPAPATPPAHQRSTSLQDMTMDEVARAMTFSVEDLAKIHGADLSGIGKSLTDIDATIQEMKDRSATRIFCRRFDNLGG